SESGFSGRMFLAFVRLLCAKCNLQNGADGISDIEGKVARVTTREFGNARVSNQTTFIDRAVDFCRCCGSAARSQTFWGSSDLPFLVDSVIATLLTRCRFFGKYAKWTKRPVPLWS